MPQQLAFDLPANVRLEATDFFVSSANEIAFAMLQTPDGWPNSKLALIGPSGSGKTHLSRMFAQRVNANVVQADAITADTPLPTGPIVVEDGDRLRAAGEEWLFHTHNHLAREGHPLLLTAQIPPARWDIALPDLVSRLSATTTAQIENPDDALLTAVLLKLFADRQLAPAPDAVAFLLRRLPRSFQALYDIVDTLDREALAQSKALTRPFVKGVLDSLPPDAR